jgi:uncharacterized protein YggU (UPF0235/DUF167 family)
VPRARVTIRLTSNAGAERIDGVVDGVLRARVAARPVDGAANEALIRLFAAELGMARSRISIVRGASSRVKIAQLDGVEPAALRSRWPGVDV